MWDSRGPPTQPGAQPPTQPGAQPGLGQGQPAPVQGNPIGTYAKKNSSLLLPPSSLLLNPKPCGRSQSIGAGASQNRHTHHRRQRGQQGGESPSTSADVAHRLTHAQPCPWRGRAEQDTRKEKLLPPRASLLPTDDDDDDDDDDDGTPLKTGVHYPCP